MRIWDWSSDVCSSDLQSRPADLIAKAGPIAAVATATLAVVLLDLEERGVAIVGDIPQSLPPFTMPLFDAGLWQQLAIPALLLSIIGFVESVSVAQRSEEHTSELQSLMRISYAVFCLKKKTYVTHTHVHH